METVYFLAFFDHRLPRQDLAANKTDVPQIFSINTELLHRSTVNPCKQSARSEQLHSEGTMQPIDRLIQLIISIFLIVGVYQFYFWCQRNPLAPSRELRLPIDDLIPYRPRWVWIYSFLYYPVIVAVNWSVHSPREYLYVAISYTILLVCQMAFFTLLPVATPNE